MESTKYQALDSQCGNEAYQRGVTVFDEEDDEIFSRSSSAFKGHDEPEFSVHILPRITHTNRKITTSDEYTLRVDRILLPAIRQECLCSEIQYYPRSFKDTESKTYSHLASHPSHDL